MLRVQSVTHSKILKAFGWLTGQRSLVPNLMMEFELQDSHGGRRESILFNCPVTSLCICAHKYKNVKFDCLQIYTMRWSILGMEPKSKQNSFMLHVYLISIPCRQFYIVLATAHHRRSFMEFSTHGFMLVLRRFQFLKHFRLRIFRLGMFHLDSFLFFKNFSNVFLH